VQRLAYRHRGHQNLHPADAALNLPVERHSRGLRRLATTESTRGSFEQAGAAISRASGQQVGKRQVEELTARAAVDIEDFYATAEHTAPAPDDVLVLSADALRTELTPCPSTWTRSPRCSSPTRRERTRPRAVKRARHNKYRVKKPGEPASTRHTRPATIMLHTLNPRAA
jgi:hypothetical protein